MCAYESFSGVSLHFSGEKGCLCIVVSWNHCLFQIYEKRRDSCRELHTQSEQHSARLTILNASVQSPARSADKGARAFLEKCLDVCTSLECEIVGECVVKDSVKDLGIFEGKGRFPLRFPPQNCLSWCS